MQHTYQYCAPLHLLRWRKGVLETMPGPISGNDLRHPLQSHTRNDPRIDLRNMLCSNSSKQNNGGRGYSAEIPPYTARLKTSTHTSLPSRVLGGGACQKNTILTRSFSTAA